MALPKNEEEVTTGLNFGASAEVKEGEQVLVRPQNQTATPDAPAGAPSVPAEKTEEPVILTDMKSFYRKEFGSQILSERETMSVRKQVVITPSLDKKLKKAVKSREIKSMNHLVNVLLELYFAGKLTLGEVMDDENM